MQGRAISDTPDVYDVYDDAAQVILQILSLPYGELMDHIQKIAQRYSLSDENAVNFCLLTHAMKKELGYKGTSGLSLTEASDKFTKERLMVVGETMGLSAAEVTALLPAIAMKLTASEIKFTLSAFKGGLFSTPQELNEAMRDIDNKYTQRFGL